ncbi:MAG TPA: hypothetical protein PKK64_06305 [Saprospiraceae bacterium]|nr:hypothetical protein [Chitinophagales bacterium]HMX88336.1 hypothetical protein [Saprospiraceae bacterium]HNB30910.1 hypothetical protein [Saprospiraceae bacterium]HNE63040.1 hypothetical protein [Saprospiraceae bacterium]HNF11297.1 hypothetical protein [Saprospiraceae bacterium]
MKKTIILLNIFLFCNSANLVAQIDSNRLNYIYLKLEDTTYFNSRFENIDSVKEFFNEAIELIKSKYYSNADQFIAENNSRLLNLVDMWQFTDIEYYIDRLPTQLNLIYNGLICSQKYINLSGNVLYDSLFNNLEHMLLHNEPKNLIINYLRAKLQEINNCDQLSKFMHVFGVGNDEEYYFELYKAKIDLIRLCEELYTSYLFILKRTNYSLKNQKLDEELTYINSQSDIDQDLKHKLISIIDSTYIDPWIFQFLNRNTDIEDSLRLKYELGKQEELRLRDSIEQISSIPIYDSLSAEEKRNYRIFHDTTLRIEIGSFPGYELGDLGIRFDTFSTFSLFSILDTFNFSNVYQDVANGFDLNSRSDVINLRKIFQLLGDRCAYGLFVPDSSQRLVLDQWIDDYYAMACIDTIYFKSNEACDQMLRMWRLLYPKLKNWIGIESKCANGMICVLQQLSNMVTESMVVELIADGDQALANGDTARVETLGYFLARVWRELDIPENQRLPRRPVRTAVETQQWVDAYIYPALVRWNHPASWK